MMQDVFTDKLLVSWPAGSDVAVEEEADNGPDHDDAAEDGDVGERRLEHRLHDVSGNQELEAEQEV